MEELDQELLCNADFRTRLKVIQNNWADGNITTDEYLKQRTVLENEYKKGTNNTYQSNC